VTTFWPFLVKRHLDKPSNSLNLKENQFIHVQIARLSARTILTLSTHQILMDVIHIKAKLGLVNDTVFMVFSGRCAHQRVAMFNLEF
jgi:hypothetical protein